MAHTLVGVFDRREDAVYRGEPILLFRRKLSGRG